MLTKVYIVDYDNYLRGGSANPILRNLGCSTYVTNDEPAMLEHVADLKRNNLVGNIRIYTGTIIRDKEYEINSPRATEIEAANLDPERH